MTQEEKYLLLKDLCGRLLSNTFVTFEHSKIKSDTILSSIMITQFQFDNNLIIKPYLRSLDKITEEEICDMLKYCDKYAIYGNNIFDWYDMNHFDYRDLIPMGLALEAKEGMYNTKN